MDEFVCVRIVQFNAADLALFQFDYDLTFAVFFMNADRTIYGRYGSRSSHEDAERDVSLEGFRKSLAEALALHGGYPGNRASLRGKQPRPVRFQRPEDYPTLRGRFPPELDYEGSVARSCMHCHQVREAERLVYREARRPIPDEVLFPYPMPDAAGLDLDPAERALVRRVEPGSPADRDGFRAGDRLLSLDGQPMLSIADVQWVLHHAKDPARLGAEVLRDGDRRNLTLTLDRGWRRRSDLAWRVSTWDLRRMAGGLLLEELTDDERRRVGIADDRMALRLKHVGEYGEHAAARRAGFRKGDILVELGGRTRRMTETDLLVSTIQQHRRGAQVPAAVLRDGRRIELTLPVQ